MTDVPPADASARQSPTTADWRRTHAFGWPGGSVRALMALLVFGTLWGTILLRPDRELPEYLKDLLFIILGHYFAVRARSDAMSEPGPPMLDVPLGSMLVILSGELTVAALLLLR